MEAAKSSNCYVVCGKSYFEQKDFTNDFEFFSCDCLGDRCRWCYLWRMQEAYRRAQTNWIVTFYRVIAISSYRWSFEVLTFLWAFFRALTVLLVQCTSNFSGRIKVYTGLYLVSKVFFDMNHNRRGRGQLRVKKSKTTLVLEIRSLRQRAC